MIEFIRNVRDTKRHVGMDHPYQIKVDFELGIVGILHIIVYEIIGDSGRLYVIVLIYCQIRHGKPSFFVSVFQSIA